MILLHLRPTVAPPVAEPQSIDRSCCNELNVTFADDHELFPNVSKVDAGWGPGSKTLLNSARGLYHAEPVVARNPNTKGAFGVLLLYTHATHTSKWRIYRQETPTTHKAVRLLTSCPACESPASAQLGLGLSAAASLRASRHTGLIAPQPRVSQVWVLGECNPSHRDTCGIMNLQARAIGFSDAKCAVDVLPDQWKVIDASNAAVASWIKVRIDVQRIRNRARAAWSLLLSPLLPWALLLLLTAVGLRLLYTRAPRRSIRQKAKELPSSASADAIPLLGDNCLSPQEGEPDPVGVLPRAADGVLGAEAPGLAKRGLRLFPMSP
jgi:hypothetical protein